MLAIIRCNRPLARFVNNVEQFSGRSLSSNSSSSDSGDSSSGSDSDNDTAKKQSKDGAKKSAVKSTRVVIKSKNSVTTEQQSKMAELLKNAQNFKPTSQNDPNSMSQKLGKPTTFIRESAKPSDQQQKQQLPQDDTFDAVDSVTKGLDKRLVEAAKRVAKRMPKHLSDKTERELLNSLEQQKNETSKAKAMRKPQVKEDYTKSISYQILRQQTDSLRPADSSKSRVVRKSRQNQIQDELFERMESTVEKIQLRPRNDSFAGRRGHDFNGQKARTSMFVGERLNIFDPKASYSNTDLYRNTLWDQLATMEKDAKKQPMNPFEEAIQWTKEGKLWQFPIDNEQGLEDEAEVPFYEHVLLDGLLDTFPDKGPVRQFMELVIMGLSHNPYITVERKHDTIEYYRQFFEDNNLMNIAEQSQQEQMEARA